MKKIFPVFLVFILILVSCSKSDDQYIPVPTNSTTIPINVDLTQVPFAKLSDYHFFDGEMKNQNPAANVLPYEPASSLFTDYAKKKRFVWMPSGLKATFNGNNSVLELPVGAALIKTFYYDHVQPSNSTRIMETRIMIRKSTGWIFAEYIWNADQTEANLNLNGSYSNVSWNEDNTTPKSTNYRFPSATECMICHKSNDLPIPIGIKPQNLNLNYNYSGGSKNQLTKWVEQGYLQNAIPSNIVSTVNYKDVTNPLDLRVRSYLDINCAHCHQQNSHCDYRPMRFAFSETTTAANLGICIPPQDLSIGAGISSVIQPNNTSRSMLFYRLNTTEESYRMPLLGRTMIHSEGITMIQQWINSLPPCN